MNLIDKYMFEELDNDMTYYRVIKASVTRYKGTQPRINDLLKDFSEKVDNFTELRVFIKRNRLFWTYENELFYTTPTCWVSEWDLIEQLIKDFEKIPGVKDVFYFPGELD